LGAKLLAPGRENGMGSLGAKRFCVVLAKLLRMVVATAISVAAIPFVMNLLGLQPPRP
jgi:hypothetical protein